MGGMILPGVVKSVQQISIAPLAVGDNDVTVSAVNVAKSVVIPGTGSSAVSVTTVNTHFQWIIKSSTVVTLRSTLTTSNYVYYATLVEYW